jgi:putative flippase GtrA
MSVSVITTVISVSTLALATVVFGIIAWVANVVATGVATGPGYYLNRRWTWGLRDRSDLWREMLPFWVLSFAGLALSTVAVAWTDAWAAHAQLTGATRTFTIVAAHLSGFGALWIVQFVLLDRLLFRRSGDRAGLSSSSHAPAPIVMNGAGVAGCAFHDQRSARSGRDRSLALPPCAEDDPSTRHVRSG